MFDNITRHFSLKGDDRIAIGTSIGEIENVDEKPEDTPVELNEKDIDTIEIDDHTILDDLIHADDDADYIDEEVAQPVEDNSEQIFASNDVDDFSDAPNNDADQIEIADDMETVDEKPVIVANADPAADPLDEVIANFKESMNDEDVTLI